MTRINKGDDRYDDVTLEVVMDPHDEDLFPGPIGDKDETLLLESYRRLKSIYALSRKICATTHLEDLLNKIVETLITLIPLERCFIAVVTETGELQPIICHNITLPDKMNDWPVSNTILSKAVKEGISILSSDALIDERFSKVKSISFHNIQSVICVPLGPKESCNGIIYCDNRWDTHPFSEHDLYFLSVLSHYIDLSIRNAAEFSEIQSQRQLSDERCSILQNELLRDHKIVGNSQKMLKVYDDLKRYAEKDVSILLLGETGTGKELFAKAVHKLSNRCNKIFLPLSIAELSQTIIESELFGHEKGAFSGALSRKIGRLEIADQGTLFLDEIGEIPLYIQAKLLRVFETGQFMRVGGTKFLHTNVRLVCATNRDLQDMIRKDLFREDLFYRLKGATINIPPLRERKEDITALFEYALKKIGSKKNISKLTAKHMKRYFWPGNVRQLMHLAQELDAICRFETIEWRDLPAYMVNTARYQDDKFIPLKDVLAQVEENHIRRALELTDGDKNKSIQLLGVSRATFFERIKRYKL